MTRPRPLGLVFHMADATERSANCGAQLGHLPNEYHTTTLVSEHVSCARCLELMPRPKPSALYTMLETQHTESVVCPWCRHEHSDSWEFSLEPERETDIDCHACGRSFRAVSSCRITYSTFKPKPDQPPKGDQVQP